MGNAKNKDGADGLNLNSSVNREAYREMRVAQETRASQQGDTSPDTAEAMDRQFATEDYKRGQEVDNFMASQNRAAYVKSQRDYFNSVSEGMTAQSILNNGGVQLANTQSIEGGAAGIVAAGGQRKGSRQTIEGGAAGIVAAGGQKTAQTLGIGSTFREQLNAVRWGSAMQKIRTAEREYKRRQKEKKENDGGLAAARQRHTGKNFFSHRPMFTVGSVTYNPMTFNSYFPQVGTYRACEEGWPPMTDGPSDTLNRVTLQTGRNYRASQPLYGP